MNKRDILIGLAAGGVILAIIWDPFIGAFLHRQLYRAEVRALYDSLLPGMTREEVSRQLDARRYPHLTFHRGTGERWSAEAPLEFGAGNWILLIEFRGERAHALRVRTADGLHDHPTEAPPDRLLPDAPSPYAEHDSEKAGEGPPNDQMQRTGAAQATDARR